MASISKIWRGLHDSGRLILMRLQDTGTQKVAIFKVLSDSVGILS
jgi:hypothetical protein